MKSVNSVSLVIEYGAAIGGSEKFGVIQVSGEYIEDSSI